MELFAYGAVAGILFSVAVWCAGNPPLPHAGNLVAFRKTPSDARPARQGVLSRLWGKLIAPVIRLAAKQDDRP